MSFEPELVRQMCEAIPELEEVEADENLRLAADAIVKTVHPDYSCGV